MCQFSRRPGRARVGTLAEITNTAANMKTADADPYEFFRWKSSCGRLVVRTTWVSGVRHVLLSDDDKSLEKEKRLQHRRRATLVDRGAQSSRTADDHDDKGIERSCNDDDNYMERVLQWLQKPSAELDARRKPMSAPGSDVRGGCRRPALVKTCSIPERHSQRSEHRQAIVIHDKRPTKRSVVKSRHKTELHVHMPSVMQGSSSVTCTTADNGKIANVYEGISEYGFSENNI